MISVKAMSVLKHSAPLRLVLGLLVFLGQGTYIQQRCQFVNTGLKKTRTELGGRLENEGGEVFIHTRNRLILQIRTAQTRHKVTLTLHTPEQ